MCREVRTGFECGIGVEGFAGFQEGDVIHAYQRERVTVALTIRRQKRIADLIQRELSDIVHRRVKDPRLEGVTITGARVSPDYQYADVYFYRLGRRPGSSSKRPSKGSRAQTALSAASWAARLTIRHTPELRFHLDESIDYGDHIETLFAQLRQERQAER